MRNGAGFLPSGRNLVGVQVSPACAIIARNRSQASPSAIMPLPVPGCGALLIAQFIQPREVGKVVGSSE